MQASNDHMIFTAAHSSTSQVPTFTMMSTANNAATSTVPTAYKLPDQQQQQLQHQHQHHQQHQHMPLIDPNQPQAFCLRWNNYQSNLTSVFEQLLQNEQFVDVTLSCDNLSIKAHKVVLSACSPYFTALFNENPCKHPIIIMRDIKFSELKSIVEFMYRGEINVCQDQIAPLLRIAELLKIRGLADVSTDHKVEVETTTTTTTTNISGENATFVIDQVLELTKPMDEQPTVVADWNANVPAALVPSTSSVVDAANNSMPCIPVTIAAETLVDGQVYMVQEINVKPTIGADEVEQSTSPAAPADVSPTTVSAKPARSGSKPHRKRKLTALLAMPVTVDEVALLRPGGSAEKASKRATKKQKAAAVKTEGADVYHELVIDEEMKANQSSADMQAVDESTNASSTVASAVPSATKEEEEPYDSDDQSSDKVDEKAFSNFLKLKAPTWSQLQLREAIAAVISQKLRFTQASSRYNIPKGTLYDNILGKANRMLVLEESSLDANAEKAVLEFCCDVSVSPYNRRTRKPLAKILEFVQTLSDALSGGKCTVKFDGKFGFRWWWAFCKKYSIVSLHYDSNANEEQDNK